MASKGSLAVSLRYSRRRFSDGDSLSFPLALSTLIRLAGYATRGRIFRTSAPLRPPCKATSRSVASSKILYAILGVKEIYICRALFRAPGATCIKPLVNALSLASLLSSKSFLAFFGSVSSASNPRYFSMRGSLMISKAVPSRSRRGPNITSSTCSVDL